MRQVEDLASSNWVCKFVWHCKRKTLESSGAFTGQMEFTAPPCGHNKDCSNSNCWTCSVPIEECVCEERATHSVCPWKTLTECMDGSLKSHSRKVVSLDEVTTSRWVGWVQQWVSSWSCPAYADTWRKHEKPLRVCTSWNEIPGCYSQREIAACVNFFKC